VTVDFNPKFHHAGDGAAIHHDVVHCERIKDADSVAHDLGAHQAASVFFVLSRQHGRERCLKVLKRDVSDEPEAPLIDPDEGNAERCELPSNAQHGAVTANDQTQVTVGANFGYVHDRQRADARIGGCFLLNHHLATLGAQKLFHVAQHVPH